MAAAIPFQPPLFPSSTTTAINEAFSRLERIQLDDSSWVDYAPNWVSGADALFEAVLHSKSWKQHERWMYEKKVLEPRLTAAWSLKSGEPLEPPVLERMRACLGAHYGRGFDSVGFNLYRDGRDSVAWHRDRITREIEQPIVALVSLGERRKFLMRPRGGGRSRPFALGDGDLLVTGGDAQRAWEHTVPKVAKAGVRISLAFRYGLDPKAYGDERAVEGSIMAAVG